MRKYLTYILGLFLLPLTLAVAGCNFPGSTNSAGSTPVSTEITTKALYTAEAAFQGATVALSAAVDSGQLKGERAAKALMAYDKAKEALDIARTTKQQADVVLATDLVATLWGLLRNTPS